MHGAGPADPDRRRDGSIGLLGRAVMLVGMLVAAVIHRLSPEAYLRYLAMRYKYPMGVYLRIGGKSLLLPNLFTNYTLVWYFVLGTKITG
jgi:hypothetical protein